MNVFNVGDDTLDAWMSGLFGGLVPALLAATVALIVLVGTNRNTTAEGEVTRKRQEELHRESLEAQRGRDQKTLEAQEKALREQLDAQRKEASRDREHAAISDAIGVAQRMGATRRMEVAKMLDLLHEFHGATLRWRLEVDTSEPMVVELFEWPKLFEDLLNMRLRGGGDSSRRLMVQSADDVRHAGVDWFQADESEQDAVVTSFREARLRRREEMKG